MPTTLSLIEISVAILVIYTKENLKKIPNFYINWFF